MARILVIDDDHRLRAALREMLEEAGHRVMEAGDGATGIKVFREQGADVVVVGIIMPGKGGIATIGELHMEFPDTKIIAISGGNPSGPQSDLPIAGAFGAARSLQKPFHRTQFLQTVDELVA